MSLLLTLSSGFSSLGVDKEGWSEVARSRRSLDLDCFVECLTVYWRFSIFPSLVALFVVVRPSEFVEQRDELVNLSSK